MIVLSVNVCACCERWQIYVLLAYELEKTGRSNLVPTARVAFR